jgi:hypothetical protein
MKKNVVSTAAVLSLVALATCPLSAFSLSFDQMLRDYLGKGLSNAAAPSQDLVKTNINTRQAQLEQEVEAGVRAGQVTPQEETDLRNQLNYIASLEGDYLADGTLSNFETQNLIDEMSNFGQRLNIYLTNANTTGGTGYNSTNWFHRYVRGGAPDAIPTNQSLITGRIDSKQAEIDTNIEGGITSRRLNWTDAQNLRQELNRIASLETQFLADGKITYGEEQQLVRDLNSLSNKVAQKTSGYGHRGGSRRGGVNYQQSLLRQRINQGLSSGRITRSEANKLFRDEARITQIENDLRASGGRLNYAEQRRLLNELDKLSRQVNKELWDRQVQ